MSNKSVMFEFCPECKSPSWIPSDDWEYDCETATREIECLECGCMWKWRFKFVESQVIVSGGREKLLDENVTSGSPLDNIEEEID